MKLSKSKKEQLVSEILKRKFGDKEKSLTIEMSKVGLDLIKKELSGIPWKACEKYVEMISFCYMGEGRYSHSAETVYVTLSDKIPRKRSGNWFLKAADNPEVKKLVKKSLGIEKEKSEVKEMLLNVMNSCNTEKQLIDTIPEMQPILNSLFDSGITTSIVAIETVEKVRSLLS